MNISLNAQEESCPMAPIERRLDDDERSYFALAQDQLELVRKWASVDRRKLQDAECTLDGNVFSASFQIQLFEEMIAGFVSRIVKYGSVFEPCPKDLREPALLFGDQRFRDWFNLLGTEYPKLCVYVELLDYMRLRLVHLSKLQ